MYNQPTQKALDMGLFEIKKTVITKPNGNSLVTTTTKVTGKGQIYFVNKFLYDAINESVASFVIFLQIQHSMIYLFFLGYPLFSLRWLFSFRWFLLFFWFSLLSFFLSFLLFLLLFQNLFLPLQSI